MNMSTCVQLYVSIWVLELKPLLTIQVTWILHASSRFLISFTKSRSSAAFA
jgi:hypothetical protein